MCPEPAERLDDLGVGRQQRGVGREATVDHQIARAPALVLQGVRRHNDAAQLFSHVGHARVSRLAFEEHQPDRRVRRRCDHQGGQREWCWA